MNRYLVLGVVIALIAAAPITAQQRVDPVQLFTEGSVQPRSIDGATCTTSDTYVLSGTTTMCWTVTNTSPDSEWLSGVELTFPAGWTVACNSQDAADSGANVVTMSCNASGNVVTYADADGGYGEVYDGESWGFCVDVTAGADPAPQNVDYTITGDGWGSEPHTVVSSTSVVPVELMSFSVE